VDEDGPRVAAHFGNELYVVHFTPELVQKHMAARYPGAPYQTAIATEKCAQEYFLAPGNDGVQLLADGRLGTLNEGEQSPVFAVAREAMMKRHSLEHLPESVHYRSMEPAADTLQRHDKERDDLARRFSRIDFSMDSPWGKVEDGGWIVKGHCYTVDTARHGGVRVSEKVNQEIPEALRDEEGWYEEDRAWSIPFAFSGLGAGKYGPVESPFYSFESACETASRYYPEEYRKLKMPPQLDQLPPAREDVELHSRATDSTELFKASANGHTDTLKTQIEALFHARAANNEALRLASSHGDTDTVKALLDAGADVNADYDVALRIASRNGHTETVKALIAAGADVHKAGGSAIWAASGRGHIETVKALLEAGADVHDTNEAALRLAVDNRHAEVVRTLLEAGADVHVSDGYALSEASFNGYTEIVKVLLDAGAILGTHYDQALRWASGNGHTETVKLLLDAGADLHVLDDLPLRGASAEGHTETVKLLIDAGANVGARNQEALRLAAEKNQVETVRALLKAGADVRVFDSPAKQLMRQMYHAEKDTRELVRPSPELVSGAKDSAPEKTADRERIRSTDSKLLTPQERAIQRRMLVAEAAADRPTPEPGHER
jgi:ankyrin repeat protein